jgi:hypothetical protein
MKSKIQLLRDHNKWRRGADTEMTNPRELGIAIDAVCKQAERYEYLRTLNAEQFADLYRRNIKSGVRFSVLLDEMMEDVKCKEIAK